MYLSQELSIEFGVFYIIFVQIDFIYFIIFATLLLFNI